MNSVQNWHDALSICCDEPSPPFCLHTSRRTKPMASSVHYTVIVVIEADSILTGWLCNVTGMFLGKSNGIWSQSFGAMMTSPSFLTFLIKNLAVDLCSEGFLHVSLKFSFLCLLCVFPSCLPSAPCPPPLLAHYSAETHYLGSRTGKCTCVQC